MRETTSLDGVGEDLISAAIKLLGSEGAASLRVRKVADAAGVSTMAVYSRFGDMATLLNAVYDRGFEMLEAHMRSDGDPGQGLEELERLGLAYRQFALTNPSLFALMFERPLPGFDPTPQSRSSALDATFGLLVAVVTTLQADGVIGRGEPRWLSYLIWIGVHGTVSLEATYVARSPLGGWLLDGDADGADAVRATVHATCAGLRSR